jgi:intracellular sulfur oxidation DsrE/DsrF family protein
MEKWVLQVMNEQNWEHALMMVNQNLGKLDLKVVALGMAVVPLFAPGKLRSAVEEAIGKGLSLEICSVSMAAAGLERAEPPKGAITNPGLKSIAAARTAGFTYFVVA